MLVVPGKLIYVHVEKTGGGTIDRLIGQHVGRPLHVGGRHSPIMPSLVPTFDDCFKFASVRNPWDRMVSWWHWAMSRPRRASQYVKRHGRQFRDFILDCAAKQNLHVRLPNRTNIYQLRKITNRKGKLLVDFVVRYESYVPDVIRAFEQLDVNLRPRDFPHVNKTNHDHYSTYYDDETREAVADMFEDEIDFFGYRFEEE